MDDAIVKHVRRKHGIIIGATTAEEVKIQIGCVYPRDEDASMTVKGRDAKTGMPREVTLLASEIFEVLRRPARQIADEVQSVLDVTSPELVGDISQTGITLTGVGCQIILKSATLKDNQAISGGALSAMKHSVVIMEVIYL